MKTIGVSELKTHCLAIVDEIAKNGTSVLVSKRGKIVARIVPAPTADQGYPQDRLTGTVTTLGDIVGPLIPDSEVEAMAARELSHPVARTKAKPKAKGMPPSRPRRLAR